MTLDRTWASYKRHLYFLSLKRKKLVIGARTACRSTSKTASIRRRKRFRRKERKKCKRRWASAKSIKLLKNWSACPAAWRVYALTVLSLAVARGMTSARSRRCSRWSANRQKLLTRCLKTWNRLGKTSLSQDTIGNSQTSIGRKKSSSRLTFRQSSESGANRSAPSKWRF